MLYRVGFAAAFVGLAVLLWAVWVADNNTEFDADDIASPETENTGNEPLDTPLEAASQQTNDDENREQQEKAVTAVGLFGRVSPAEVESAILQRIAEQSGLKFVSINSVECDLRRCEVAFSGVDANPQHVGDYGDMLSTMMSPPWNDFQTTSGGIGTREISPGVREYVLGVTYVALVEASADPEVAARQHAACAGAWARVTEQRGSEDYLRGAHERSAEWLDRSASVLGLEEAQRVAEELRYGPLTRDCHAMPY